MMAEVKSIDKDQMVRTFFAVLRKDTDQVIHTLTTMGLIEPVSDMAPIRRVMGFVLERFTEKPIALQEFSQVKQEVSALFAQQPFRLPAKMTFILKALTTLDGVARDLDPHYSLLESAKPFVKSITVAKGQSGGIGLGELTKQAREYITYKLRQPSATDRLIQRLEERLEQGEVELRSRSLETDRAIKTINLALKSLTYACLTGFSLLSGAVLLVGAYKIWAFVAFGLAGLGTLFLIRSLIALAIRERIDRLVK
jgi:predicted unusual protein kinase regulating ubiquinone biosynthesis (AarF/ABC1/UbiB family)